MKTNSSVAQGEYNASPRLQTSSRLNKSVRRSLNLSIKHSKNNRSVNSSQVSERLKNSPRDLNSQRQSPRLENAMNASQEYKKGLKENNSYLDSSYNSMAFFDKSKTSTAFSSRRRTQVNRSMGFATKKSSESKQGFAFNFYKMPR